VKQRGGEFLDIGQVQGKLAEAHHFLNKMIKRERQLIGEPFKDYLTAFLAAGMSVRDGFCYRDDRKRNAAIKAWREKWENDPNDQHLYELMRQGRHDEAHIARKRKACLKLCVGQEEIPVGPTCPGRAELRASGLQVSF
jgi:hypothetical protein